MNNISLTGRLTRDPESETTSGGTPVCKLRIAFETRRGEPVFVDVESYGNGAKAAAERLAKGDLIGVSGELALDQWKDRESDQPRSRYYVVGQVHFLALRSSIEGSGGAESPAQGKRDEDIPF